MSRDKAGRHFSIVVVDHFRVVVDNGNVSAMEERKRAPDHAGLKGGVAWFAEWAPEWELAVEEPGCLDVLGLAADQGDPNCSHAGCFEDSREHTDGARAKRSNGGEKHDIDAVVTQYSGGGRPAVEQDRGEGGVGLCAHE